MAKRLQTPMQGGKPSGPWIAAPSGKPSGASGVLVQEAVGQWLGILTVIAVDTTAVLSEDECSLISIALQHKFLYRDRPVTASELVRIADAPSDQKVCKCTVHTGESDIQHQHPQLLGLLKNIMPCSAELNGRYLAGNLTNIALYLLNFIIKEKAGLTDLQIQPEMKSDASTEAAGSKSVFDMGCGERYLTVESTPDFYVRKQTPIVYFMIGEVESAKSKSPEVQLAIGALAYSRNVRRQRSGQFY